MYVCMHVCKCMYVCMHLCMYVCMHLYIMCTYVCMYVCIYILCMYVCRMSTSTVHTTNIETKFLSLSLLHFSARNSHNQGEGIILGDITKVTNEMPHPQKSADLLQTTPYKTLTFLFGLHSGRAFLHPQYNYTYLGR
jgi:hypothetical protein